MFPIPAFSDHGVHLATKLTGPERGNPARTHLSWSSWRADAEEEEHRKIVKLIHPWVPYRRGIGLQKKTSAYGTLFFAPHSVPGHVAEPFNYEEYLIETLQLPAALQPRAICIAMHDVHLGLHRELRKFGLPVISAGNSASPLFVDRFYDLVSRFSFATSPGLGTQTFLCEELGVSYFLYGKRPERPRSISAIPGISTGDARRNHFESIFRDRPEQNRLEKQEVVRAALNLDLDNEQVRLRIRKLFLRQLFLLLPYILKMFPVYLRKKFR